MKTSVRFIAAGNITSSQTRFLVVNVYVASMIAGEV
jgi:hypothetical protein